MSRRPIRFAARSARLPCWLLLAAGCARQGAPLATPPQGMTGGVEQANDAAMTAGPPSSGLPKPGGTAAGAFPPVAPPAGEEPTPDKALPELSVAPLGMHIGGGTNTPEEKAPFHRAIERQFPAFLACYRLVDDPWGGGSFGVDLKIGRHGGPPTLEQPRTKIRGAGFKECMVDAFGKVQFDKPKAGPTVVSYSVMFNLGRAAKR
jgi:hypothetical protein